MKQSATAIRREPLWTHNFLITAISNLFLFFSFQMLIPTIPIHVAQMGGDDIQVGLVIGLFTIASLLTRPFAGKALDKLGRKQVLIVGLMICTFTIAGYSYMAAVTLILAGRFVHGVGWGISTTSLGTVIADIIPSTRRGEGMGYYGLSNTLAMALAPMSGIWLMNHYGFQKLLFVSSLLAIMSLSSSLFISYPIPSPSKKPGLQLKWSDQLWERTAIFPSLLLMLTAICYGGIVTFITLFGREVGISNVGWFFLSNAAMVLIVRPLTGVLFDRKGPKWVLIPGAFFTIGGLLLLSYARTEGGLILAALCYGAGFGSLQPALQAWTISRADPSRRGAASGTFFSANDLGIGIGAMVLGAVAKLKGSYADMYRFSIVLMIIYLAVYGWFCFVRPVKRNADV
jgi:MFS family permease